MSDLFYDAAPNATRVAPPLPTPRQYPAKPQQVYLFGTCVVDLFFPEAGLDAIRLIREKEARTGAHLPIVALTAYAMRGDQERCLAAGADAYVSKPVDPQRLLEDMLRLTDQPLMPAGAL